MKSDNPHSGIYVADTSRTLDINGGNPACNQGGIVVVQGIDGYNGDVTGDKAATLGVNCGLSTGRNGVITFEPGIAAREGGHIYEDVSGTLRANAGDNKMSVAYTLKIRSGCEGGGKGALVQTDKSATLSTLNDQYLFQPIIDKHILDDQGGSQITVRDDGKCPTLRAETHGNVPCVMELESNPDTVCYDARGNGDGDVAPTITGDHNNRITDYTTIVCNRECQKNVGALCARDYKGVGSQYVAEDKLVIEQTPQYVVRRLTPTECARLQGFVDGWGIPDKKDDFTDEEYEFWLNVRKTYDEINGRKPKDYTKKQMLSWYNKLHTDSSEYKMWGNGIALPNALYVMQGIAETFN